MSNTDVDIYARLNEMALPSEERNAVVSWEDLVTPETIAEIPNPYRVIENKDELVGVGFFVREAVFKEPDASDYDNDYVILYCVTPKEMVILTDGGTGIRNQMKAIVNKRIDQGIADATQNFYFPNGLRKSEYVTYTLDGETQPLKKGQQPPKGSKPGKGETYYFA